MSTNTHCTCSKATQPQSLTPSPVSPIAPLISPPIEKLTHLHSNYHTWALQIRSSLLLADPDLWAVTSGLRPRCHEDFVAMELLHLRACAWIYLHLSDEVLGKLRMGKGSEVDGDAFALWREVRRMMAPEVCSEGNEGCMVDRGQKFAFVDLV